MRSAAARAATRRGLRRMTWPVHHGSPSSAGATAVVLPAPGGATSTADFRARSAASRSGRTAWIGRSASPPPTNSSPRESGDPACVERAFGNTGPAFAGMTRRRQAMSACAVGSPSSSLSPLPRAPAFDLLGSIASPSKNTMLPSSYFPLGLIRGSSAGQPLAAKEAEHHAMLLDVDQDGRGPLWTKTRLPHLMISSNAAPALTAARSIATSSRLPAGQLLDEGVRARGRLHHRHRLSSPG